MAGLLPGLLFTECAKKQLTALQKEDKSVLLNILLEISYCCKLCEVACVSASEAAPSISRRWEGLDQIKAHLFAQHAGHFQRTDDKPVCMEQVESHGVAPSDRIDIKRVKPELLALPVDVGLMDQQSDERDTCVTSSKPEHTGLDAERHQSEIDDDEESCAGSISHLGISSDDESCTGLHEELSYPSIISVIKDDLNVDLRSGLNPLGRKTNTCRRKQNSRNQIASSENTMNITAVHIEADDVRETSNPSDAEFSDSGNKFLCETPKKHKLVNKSRTCAVCHVTMDTIESCLMHYLDKHDLGNKLRSVSSLVPQSRVTQNLTNWFSCPMCGKKFKYNTLLKHVVLIHIWRRLTRQKDRKKDHLCAECGKVFHSDQNYYHHLRQVHQGKKRKASPYKSKQFKCTLCEYTCCEQRRIASHMKYVHSGIKTYSCQHCSYSTWERTSMRSHIYRHQETKKYSCDHCTYQCIQKKQLRGHMLHKHSLSLPKTGTTRLPAKKGPRPTFKPQVELTNRAIATDPVRSRKSLRKHSRVQLDFDKSGKSPAKDVSCKPSVRSTSNVQVDPVNVPKLSECFTLQTNSSTPYVMSSTVGHDQMLPVQVADSLSSRAPSLSVVQIPGPTAGQSQMVESLQPKYAEGTSSSVVHEMKQAATSVMQDTISMVPAREGLDASLYHYQSAPVLYQPQGLFTAKGCHQILQVEQPVTFIPHNMVDSSGFYDRMTSISQRVAGNSAMTVSSSMKTHTPLGEAITVTPIYSQTPEVNSTLNPNNSQGSFIYILK